MNTDAQSTEGCITASELDVRRSDQRLHGGDREHQRGGEGQNRDELRLVIDTIPGLVWSTLPDGHVEYLNQRWIEYTGLTLEEARGWGWVKAIHPDDLPALSDYWKSILMSGREGEFEARLRRFDGDYRWFLFRGVPLYDSSGTLTKWYGTNTDIEDRKWAEALIAGEKEILEMLAKGRSLPSLLDALCRLIESMSPGCLCSILLLDPEGIRLLHGAAPSLPVSYSETIHGSVIGPEVGPCGRAAFFKAPVIVADVATDKIVESYREFAMGYGLRACWSSPILSTNGTVLGTFAVYWRKPGQPTPQHDRIIGQITHLAAVAIERKRAGEALRASEHLALGQLQALTHTLDTLVHESNPDKLLEHVLRAIVTQSGAHSVSVWDRNEKEEWLELIAVIENGHFQSRHEALHPASRIPILSQDHPVWRAVFESGQYAVLEDIDQPVARSRVGPDSNAPWHAVLEDDRDTPAMLLLKQHLRSLGVRTILFVPMMIAGKVAGIIGIRFIEKRVLRWEEIELTRALAHQAMLAIQLMRLSRQAREEAVVEERNRLARDIHDTLAQGFTGVIVQLEAAEDATSQGLTAEAGDHVRRAGDLARESLHEARRSVRALRPQALEEKDLGDALEALIRKMTDGTRVKAEFNITGTPREFPQGWEENLLRVGQEVLTNVLRHAQASEFTANLVFEPQGIRMELHDNGRGFHPDARHEGFGLTGMKERVETMGGKLSIQSEPGAGTAVLIALPASGSSSF